MLPSFTCDRRCSYVYLTCLDVSNSARGEHLSPLRTTALHEQQPPHNVVLHISPFVCSCNNLTFRFPFSSPALQLTPHLQHTLHSALLHNTHAHSSHSPTPS